jgi:hypothetical protein
MGKWIRLREATRMSTGYRGRGLQPLEKEFSAGTKVYYERFEYAGRFLARPGETVTRILHTSTVVEGPNKYSAVKEETPCERIASAST